MIDRQKPLEVQPTVGSPLSPTYMLGDLLWHERAKGTEQHVMSMAVSHLSAAVAYVPAKKRRIAVQAGGFTGPWPAFLGHLFQSVYTFEPDADNFRCLAHNAAAWNIHPFRAALGDAPGFVRMSYWAKSGSNQVTNDLGPVPVMTVDQFNFPKLDLLALDVEGHETAVYIGAQNTIRRHRPVIIAEQSGRVSADGRDLTWQTAVKWLTNEGYERKQVVDKDSIWVYKK